MPPWRDSPVLQLNLAIWVNKNGRIIQPVLIAFQQSYGKPDTSLAAQTTQNIGSWARNRLTEWQIVGWVIVIIALVFVGYTKFGYLLPGAFSLYEYSWERLIAQTFLSQDGVYGGITYISSTIILEAIRRPTAIEVP